MEFERLIEMRQRYADGIRAEERARCLAWHEFGERAIADGYDYPAEYVRKGIESGKWPPGGGA